MRRRISGPGLPLRAGKLNMRTSQTRFAVLASILLVGLVLRVLVALEWQARLGDEQRFVFGDSQSYWDLARTIAQGEPYRYGTAAVFRTPGYPIVLASLFVLAGGEPTVLSARLLSAVLGTLAIGAVWWLGMTLFDHRVGLLAAGIVAFYPGAIALSVFVLSEAAFCPLAVLHLGLWALAYQCATARGRWAAGLGAGVAAAAATLMRPSWLLFVPLAGALSLLDRSYPGQQRRIGLAVLLGLVLGMSPWWVRNYQVTGHFVPTTLQVGASLYDGWSAAATGASNLAPAEEVARRLERQPNESDAAYEYRLNGALRDKSLRWALDHPVGVFRLAAIKVWRMWNVWPNEAQFRRWPVRVVVCLAYVPVALLAVLGAWRTRRGGFPYFLCWLPAAYLTLLHAVFVSSIRYREPAMLPLAVLAAAALTGAPFKDGPPD